MFKVAKHVGKKVKQFVSFDIDFFLLLNISNHKLYLTSSTERIYIQFPYTEMVQILKKFLNKLEHVNMHV